MALREKTIEFAIPTRAALITDATLTNLDQITLYIPEASPTITSAWVEVAFRDVNTATSTTATIGEHRVALRLGAAAYTTVTEVDDITQTGETIGGVIGPFNFLTHFTTNWSGTSMTCDIQVYFDQTSGTTLGMINVSAKVFVTYTYDDTAATQIKTVRIPMESILSFLPTAAANFGTTQIPALDTFLPEAGKVIRDWHIVIEGNDFLNATTDFTLSMDIGGADEFTTGSFEAAPATSVFNRIIYKPPVPATASAHEFRLWCSQTGRFHHVVVTLVVTYEFTLAGTTRLLNSIMLPVEIASPLGAQTTAEASRFTRDILCVEPGTLTLRQSAIRINWNAAVSSNPRVRVGGQAYRSYTSAGNVYAGMGCLQQRFDSGAVEGAGFTLARGRNNIVIDAYGSSTTNDITNVNGYIILNYESDVPTEGIGASSHSVFKTMLNWDAALTDLNRNNNYAFAIPETDYWAVAAGFCFIQWVAAAGMALTFDVECLSGEGKGAGYYDIYTDAYVSDAERACSIVWMRGRDTFRRFPQDPDPDRLDIETARDYRLFTTTACGNGMLALVTYHSMTWDVAGNLVGADAGLATDVKLFRADDDQLFGEQTLAAGDSSFSFTVYDNTENYYVVARQNDTLVGRSGNALAA
jgi:hypothetical protein